MTPDRLGRYELIRILGKGAMGIVYEGRDPNLERRVAIKTVRIENLSDEEAAEYDARFRIEARSAARMQHPNIVGVYDSGRDDDVAFLVMEYVEGKDLKHHLDQGQRYSLAESLHIVHDLLDALEYSHQQGILHRDVKPANLLVEASGLVKLTDFGVARIQNSGEATRTHGGMVGTLKYMSPEQVQGEKIDHRSDLFSAGILLYQLLTNVRPFDGDTEYAIIHQILAEDPALPSTLNPALPPAVDGLVMRALVKDRAQRYQSAREFAEALQSSVHQSDDTTVVPPLQHRRRRREPGIGTGSPSLGGTGGSATDSRASTSGSTITQELELVYWKDVRETDDTQELETFLRKFPQGVYADLARRRLRLLRGESGSTGQNPALPAGSTGDPWAPTRAEPRPGSDGTLDGRKEATAPGASQAAPASAPAEGVLAATEPAGGDSTAAPVAASPGKAAPAVVEATAGAPGPAVKWKPALAAGGLLLAVVAGLALYWGSRERPAELSVDRAAASPVATPALQGGAPAATQPVPASPVTSAVLGRAAPPATGGSGPAQASATSPRNASSAGAATSRQSASTPLVGASAALSRSDRATQAVPPSSRQAASLATPPTAGAGAVDPAEACKGRVLLGLESCLKQQCETAASRDHPVCKQRMEWDSWRQDSDRARRNQGG